MEKYRNLKTLQKYCIKSLSAVLAVSVAGAAMASCSRHSSTELEPAAFRSPVNAAGDAASCAAAHVASAEDQLKFVSQSGLEELYLDPVTFSIAVKDTTKNRFWTAIPTDGTHDASASTFGASVTSGGKVYQLNTQDNSVAFGAASYTIADEVLTLTYVMADSAATAAKTQDQLVEGDIWFSFSAQFSLVYGSLIAQIDCNSIVTAPGLSVLELDVLSHFGASSAAQAGDFMLVPDGSGAIVHTDSADALAEPVSLRVYGTDPAVNTAEEASALMGIFGAKQSDSAFCALIEQGEAVARIHAQKADGAGSFNQVWPSFILSDTSVPVGQAADEAVSVSSRQYTGQIRICYRFLSDSNASYAGMAIACREQLIRDGLLTNSNVEGGETLPFVLTTVGYSNLWEGSAKLTAYAQAQDMVQQLKAKGVDDIALRYIGALSGGYAQKDLADASFMRSLGGTGDFEDLLNYMDTQNLRLYLDINMLTASSRAAGMSKANSITGSDVTANLTNLLSPTLGGKTYQTDALTAEKSQDSLREFLKWMEDYPQIELSVNDAGSLLYSDYAHAGTDRSALAAQVSEQMAQAAYQRSLMVDTGNLYTLKNADMIVNLPLGSTYAESGAYEAVPFVQMLLHGTVEYTGTPLNLSDPAAFQTALLRSVEFGACPAYLWVYTLPEEFSDAADTLVYEQSINDAVKFYVQVNDALADLRGSRMTDHQEISEGVFMTEYDSSSLVYVNYTDADATVDGVSVPAGGFIRIN